VDGIDEAIKNFNYHTKDSGQREDFPTGSRRDTRKGKPRFDLLPWPVLERWAALMERGAGKYGDRNWEKGQPVMRYFDSGIRHAYQWLCGETSEDHLAAVLFNFGGIMFTLWMVERGQLPTELDDRPHY
jgi:hypothetical protein